MKFKCPHCSEKAVSALSKYRSYEVSPAVCDSCGKFSAEPTWINTVSSIAWTTALIVLPIIAFIGGSWMPIIIGFTLLFFSEVIIFLTMPLRPLTEGTVKRARWEIVIILLLISGISVYATIFE
jgi:hypothetical protein